MPGVKPLEIEELPSDLKSIVDTYMARSGTVPNSFRTMAHKPKIAKAYGDLQRALAESLTIPAELRTMMFHIQSQSVGCQYCQAHSIAAMSHTESYSNEKADALWEFETNPLFSAAERVALRFAQTASAIPGEVTEEDFEMLRSHYSEEQIVEIVAAMAVGAFINKWNDTMATTLEDGARGIAEGIIGERGWEVGKHA